MRKSIVFLLVIAAAVAAFGAAITDKGGSQGDLFNFLTKIQDYNNEVKADYNALYNSIQNGPHETTIMAVDGAGGHAFVTTNAISYFINGVGYSLTASAALTVLTAPAVQTNTKCCVYLVSVDSAGAYTWTKGTETAIGTTPVAPAVPASRCPIAEILVNASATFTLGTTAFNSGGTTTTVTNVRWPRTGTSALSAVAASDLDLNNP